MSSGSQFSARVGTLPCALLSLSLVIGCSDGGDRDSSMLTTITGANITSASGVGTDAAGTGLSDPSDPSSGDSESSASATGASTDASTGDPSTSSDDPTAPDGLPNGASCDNDGQCSSNFCFQIPLVQPTGLCSECKTESDCMALDLGISCSPDPVNKYAVCSDGEVGAFCETQGGCAPGNFCTEIISGAGDLLPNTCGECMADGDCPGNELCTPTLDIALFTGWRVCVPPGSVANNDPCPEDGTGDDVCTSGYCNTATIDGFNISVGLCGECTVDADCEGGMCTAAVLDLENPQGTTCS